MLSNNRLLRAIIALLAAAAVIVPIAIWLSNDNINLTGTAITQDEIIESADSGTNDSAPDDSGSEDAPADDPAGSEDESSSEPDTSTDEQSQSQESSDEESQPAPTAAPQKQPTATPPPADSDDSDTADTSDEEAGTDDDAAETPDDEESSQPSPTAEAPDNDDEPEATEEPTAGAAPSPEQTEEPSPTATPGPESTEEPAFETTPELTDPETTPELEVTEELELTAEVTPELTPEVTAEAAPLLLDITAVCTVSGVEFSITNAGDDMLEPEPLLLDDAPAGELLLASGETESILADYGAPVLAVAGMAIQPEEPCLEPPVLEISSAVCVPESGVIFTLLNSGGDMPEAQPYTLDDEPAGEFQLEADATLDIEAGYGSPAFASGDLTAIYEESCLPPGVVRGTVWLDTNGDSALNDGETGLPGLAVQLTAADGSTQHTTTAEDGRYSFEQLLIGDYTVQVTDPPADVLPGFDADGGADSSAVVTTGLDPVIADFGYQPLGSVSGVVWHDLNGDGARTEGEAGLPDVTVTLHDASGEVIHTATTSETGTYGFAELPAADYVVSIDPASLPEAVLLSFDPEGEADHRAAVSLAAGQDADAVSFGYQPAAPGAISGLIWLETGDFGVRNSNESGIAGLTVHLVDAKGDIVQSATLEADGDYQFVDVLPGTYTVQIDTATLPDRMFVTFNPDGSGEFQTAVAVQPGTETTDILFGLVGTF